MTTLREKVGYGLGDMSTSMFWKIFSFYLPIFYSDIFGLPMAATATLMLVIRIWDGISDPMMGIIADRTNTRNGKYRPYLLWMALPFAIAGGLLFTTPDGGMTTKLVWAYATYILMMTVYTAINVPYSSMLAVMTEDSNEKTVFSSYRMFFAYAGSFIALFAWEPLCKLFQGTSTDISAQQHGWQYAMYVIASACIVMFILCYKFTRERVSPPKSKSSITTDIKSLIQNKPWWILTAIALCSNLFNTVRGGTVAYYFKYYIGDNALIDLGGFEFLFYAGMFLGVGEVCNMIGVVCAVGVSKRLGKRGAMLICCSLLTILSALFFYVPLSAGGFLLMLVLQVLISILTGIISPLIWSMYADVADYSIQKTGTASSALIFSSGSMAQKFGGAMAGWGVIVLLDNFGLIPNAATQTPTALLGLHLAMSWIPAIIAAVMGLIVLCYPLGKKTRIPVSKIATAVALIFSAIPAAQATDGSEFANFARYASDNARLKAQRAQDGRIVLMGNSITDFWPQRSPQLFEKHPNIIGRGIAGQTSFQFLLRFRNDVIDLKPEIVVINYGTNDIALNSGPYDEDITFNNLISMVDLARANGIKVILASCLPAEGFSWRPEVTDSMTKIKKLNQRVRQYALDNGIVYANYFDALVNKQGTAMNKRYANEHPAVHPNAEGYAVMEQILLNAIHQLRQGK